MRCSTCGRDEAGAGGPMYIIGIQGRRNVRDATDWNKRSLICCHGHLCIKDWHRRVKPTATEWQVIVVVGVGGTVVITDALAKSIDRTETSWQTRIERYGKWTPTLTEAMRLGIGFAWWRNRYGDERKAYEDI